MGARDPQIAPRNAFRNFLSAAAQMQKNEMDKLHLETEQQRLDLLRIRATGEIPDKDGDEDAPVYE